MTEYISSAYYGNLYLLFHFTCRRDTDYSFWDKNVDEMMQRLDEWTTSYTKDNWVEFKVFFNYEVWMAKQKYQIISSMFSFRLQKIINKKYTEQHYQS